MLTLLKWVRKNLELLFWTAALISLAIGNPTGPHYTLCPLRLMGFTWCPGCGIGHAISFLLHGNLAASWHAHWLGVPALLILVYRVVQLIRKPASFSTNANPSA